MSKCVRRFLPDILRKCLALGLSSTYLSRSAFVIVILTHSYSHNLHALDGVKIFILYTFAFLANFFSALREKNKFLRYLKTKFLPMMNSRWKTLSRISHIELCKYNRTKYIVFQHTRIFTETMRRSCVVGSNPRLCTQDRRNRMDPSISSSRVSTDLSSVQLLSFINCA